MFFNRFTRLKGVGRYACLGSAVLEQLGRKYKFHNIQKGRVDYLLDSQNSPLLTCFPEKVIPHLARDYIYPVIRQQSDLCPVIVPELVLIDSFSELTDQLFKHKTEKWQFCSNYQDLKHDESFLDTFESLGLISLDCLKESYVRMLQMINTRWPGVPVIYLHFPDALEYREIFVQRGREIKRVVDECRIEFSNLYSFNVPAEIVKRPDVVEAGMESFPYHYSQETYEEFAKMILSHPQLNCYF